MAAKRRTYKRTQRYIPSSTRMWPEQWAEVQWAAERLGVSQSRLLRSAALTVAAELRAGAESPLALQR